MDPFDFHPPTRVVFGEGSIDRLGELAREFGFHRTLIVSDPAIVETGLVSRAGQTLKDAGIESVCYSDFAFSPDSQMVENGRAFAASHNVDSIIGLGGGSSMDCAKGINFVLTNGGSIGDYWGQGKATKAMLPSIGVPTTAGTGSEAQVNALISDAETHAKMACGDPKAAFKVAILDPVLTLTQPRSVTATAGYDAISHAVESFVTAPRTPVSDMFARDAWRRLEANFERVLTHPDDLPARGEMLLGSHEAGIAIAQSMLGATHACANPLTATYGTTHAVAIAVMLPHVIRWNAETVGARYADLLNVSGRDSTAITAGDQLAARLEELARAGGLPLSLKEIGADEADFSKLAQNAATQWTGTFNPRPFDASAAEALYQRAYQ
jgi:alcohol dehydrogenase